MSVFIYLVFMSLIAPKLQTVLYNRLLLWVTGLHNTKFLYSKPQQNVSKTTSDCEIFKKKYKKEIIPPPVKPDLFVKVPALLGMLNCLCRVVGWLWKHLPAITLNGWDEFCYFPSAHSSVSLFMVGFKANDRLPPPPFFFLKAGISRRDFFYCQVKRGKATQYREWGTCCFSVCLVSKETSVIVCTVKEGSEWVALHDKWVITVLSASVHRLQLCRHIPSSDLCHVSAKDVPRVFYEHCP